jgi:hypothetical protein
MIYHGNVTPLNKRREQKNMLYISTGWLNRSGHISKLRGGGGGREGSATLGEGTKGSKFWEILGERVAGGTYFRMEDIFF